MPVQAAKMMKKKSSIKLDYLSPMNSGAEAHDEKEVVY
jgi:hypothetical protein